jgi:hypothetical protein
MANERTLDQFFAAARPLIEQQLDLAEKAAELGKAAREVGFEWSQIKATLKAAILDEDDGGDRLKTLVDKHETAIGYADIAAKVNKEKFSETEGSIPTPASWVDPPNDDLDVRQACGGALARA